MYTSEYWHEFEGTWEGESILGYLLVKQQEEVSVQEFLRDFGAPNLQVNLRHAKPPLCFQDASGKKWEMCYALDLAVAVSALLLETLATGEVDLHDLADVFSCDVEDTLETIQDSGLDVEPIDTVRITATEEDYKCLQKALRHFLKKPDAYDIVEDYLVPFAEKRIIESSYGNVVDLYDDLSRDLETRWNRRSR